MGEALYELEQVLRSNQRNFTSQEANVLMQCKSNAMKDFTIGGAVSGSLAWLATRGMRSVHRINITAGAAAFIGFWRFGRSLDSCVEHILSMDGTRMQKELAKVIVRKHQGDHWAMQVIKKHFYMERVYEDSSVDQPMLRWRYRTFFDDQTPGDNADTDNDASNSDGADWEETDEPKQVSTATARLEAPQAIDLSRDPFDFIFGVPHGHEEIHHAGRSSTHQRRRQLSKRSRRKDRMRRHREASAGLQLSQL